MKPGENEAGLAVTRSFLNFIRRISDDSEMKKYTLSALAGKIFTLIEKTLSSCTDGPSCEILGDLYLSLLPSSAGGLDGSFVNDKTIAFIVSSAEGSSGEGRKLFAAKATGHL